MEKLNDLGVEKIFSLRTFLSQGQTLTGILSIFIAHIFISRANFDRYLIHFKNASPRKHPNV